MVTRWRRLMSTVAIALVLGVHIVAKPVAVEASSKEWNLANRSRPYRGTTIKLLTWSDSWNEAVKRELAPKFEKITGIKVVYDTVGWEVVSEKQVAELSAGTGAYDLMSFGHILGPDYVLSGWFTNLEEFWEEHPELIDPQFDFDDFGKTCMELVRYPPAKGVYALPIFIYSWFTAYRADWFEKKGLEPPTSWKNFLVGLKKFTEDTNGDGTIDRWGLTGPHARGYEIVESWWQWVQVFGGEYVEDALKGKYQPRIDTPAGREALYFIKTLLDKYAVPGLLTASYWDATVPYLEGEAAMLNSWVELGLLHIYGKSEYANLLGNTGYAIVPPRGADGRYGGGIFVSGIGIPSASKNKEAAWLFMQFVLNKENMKYLARFGSPVRISVCEDPRIRKEIPYISTTLKNFRLLRSPKRGWVYGRFIGFDAYTEIIARELHSALAGQKTIKEAMDKAQKDVCELFLKNNVISQEEYDAAYEGWEDVEPRLGRLPEGYMEWTKVLLQ